MRSKSKRMTILVVDDIPLMRTILSQYLRSLGLKLLSESLGVGGMEILEASDGEQALTCLREKQIDMVFLDLMMPTMDGLTFLATKREDAALAPIPTIVCSALGEKETVDRAQALGARSYIVKPFNMRSVEEKFRIALQEVPGLQETEQENTPGQGEVVTA